MESRWSISGAVGGTVSIARLCRFRYLSLTVPPFLVGALGSGEGFGSRVAISLLAIVLLRIASSLSNCITDQVEDAIDHPYRKLACERVGYGALKIVVAISVITYLVLVGVLTFVEHIYWGAAILWFAYLVLKLAYSFGPRIKTHRGGATVLLGGISGTMLFVGWIESGPSEIVVPLAGSLVLWAMGASLAGSKDAPNMDGDEKAGYRSVYRSLTENVRPLRRVLLVVARPFAVAILLALLTASTSGPGATLLSCLLAMPLAVIFALVLVRAESPLERSIVREMGYLYWIVFMDIVLVSLVPETVTVTIATGALLWYILASLYLHPDPTPYSFSQLRQGASLIKRGRPRPGGPSGREALRGYDR